MTGPKNAVVGETFGTDLPTTKINEDLLTEEKKKARYSKSKEFQDLKEYLEARVKFFENFLPNGREIRFQEVNEEMAANWVIANNIITEFKAILARYEDANKAVSDESRGY